MTSLGALVKKEQRLYLNGLKHGSVTDTRLSAGADTFRKLVETGYAAFRAKTSRDVLFHIKEVLPSSATVDELCTPLVNPYTKCLLTVCSYLPHMDHLLGSDWRELVVFCSQALSAIVKSVAPRSASDSMSMRMPVAGRDMLEVIKLFLSNKMVRDISTFGKVYWHLKFFIDIFPYENAGHALVYECLSIIVTAVTVQDIEFAKTVSVVGLNACLRLFNSKSAELRQNLCIFICHACKALALTESSEDDEDINSTLVACYSQLRSAKLRTPAFELSPRDITFYSSDESTRTLGWSTFPLLKLGYRRPQLGWLSTIALARISTLLEWPRFNDSDIPSQNGHSNGTWVRKPSFTKP